MTYFKLNIPKINENISYYNTYKKNLLEDLNYIYTSLSNTDSCWNDQNAYDFIKQVKKDRYDISEYFNYINNLYGEINKFKTNIDNICYRYGYRKNSITLKFDDSNIELCKKYLNNIIYYLNDAYKKLDVNLFIGNFENMQIIYNLRNEIKKMKSLSQDILDNIDNFSKSINNEIYESKFRIKKLSGYNFKVKPIEYIWSLKNMSVKQNGVDKLKQVTAVGTKVDFNTKNYYIDNTVSQYANPKNMGINETNYVQSINVDTKIANGNTIKFEEQNGVQHMNVDIKNSNVNEIEFENQDIVQKINVDTKNSNINEIRFEQQDIAKFQNYDTQANESKSNIDFKYSEIDDFKNVFDTKEVEEQSINFNVGEIDNPVKDIEFKEAKGANLEFNPTEVEQIKNMNFEAKGANIEFNPNKVEQINIKPQVAQENNINLNIK